MIITTYYLENVITEWVSDKKMDPKNLIVRVVRRRRPVRLLFRSYQYYRRRRTGTCKLSSSTGKTLSRSSGHAGRSGVSAVGIPEETGSELQVSE